MKEELRKFFIEEDLTIDTSESGTFSQICSHNDCLHCPLWKDRSVPCDVNYFIERFLTVFDVKKKETTDE